jgi:hypothetical protein
MGENRFLVVVGSFVLALHWQGSSCQQQHESTGYRLGGQRPTDNITVLVADSLSRQDDDASITMGPFVPYQESRPAHHPSWKPLVLDGGQDEQQPRVRRDDSSTSSNHNNKGRPAVQDEHHSVKDNSRLLVQTLNGLVRGTTKTALGDTVDVFLGVRNETKIKTV